MGESCLISYVFNGLDPGGPNPTRFVSDPREGEKNTQEGG